MGMFWIESPLFYIVPEHSRDVPSLSLTAAAAAASASVLLIGAQGLWIIGVGFVMKSVLQTQGYIAAA